MISNYCDDLPLLVRVSDFIDVESYLNPKVLFINNTSNFMPPLKVASSRYAMCSAIAATGVPALVMAKGHVISNIPEVNLPNNQESIAMLMIYHFWSVFLTSLM